MLTGCRARALALDRARVSHPQPHRHETAATVDDSMFIAGEEYPGAALDTCGFAWSPDIEVPSKPASGLQPAQQPQAQHDEQQQTDAA
jgi:hypothetical protein